MIIKEFDISVKFLMVNNSKMTISFFKQIEDSKTSTVLELGNFDCIIGYVNSDGGKYVVAKTNTSSLIKAYIPGGSRVLTDYYDKQAATDLLYKIEHGVIPQLFIGR